MVYSTETEVRANPVLTADDDAQIIMITCTSLSLDAVGNYQHEYALRNLIMPISGIWSFTLSSQVHIMNGYEFMLFQVKSRFSSM